MGNRPGQLAGPTGRPTWGAAVAALRAMASPRGGLARDVRAAVGRLARCHAAKVISRQRGWQREEDSFRDLVAGRVGMGRWGQFEPLLGDRRDLADMMGGGRSDRLDGSGRWPIGIRAKYDSAQTSDDNRMHWAMSDSLSADAANSSAVRSVLRNRARYEVANNCYACGVGLTLANDLVGTGPRLNMSSGVEAVDELVERLFAAWARAVNLPRLLRVMRLARRQDGEAFCLLVSNPGIEDPVKLGLKGIEADQVASYSGYLDPNNVDGIQFDQHGNPVLYDVLRVHPGGQYAANALQYDRWPRRYVLHWFRPSRPGQHRGVPEIVAALPLYATLRRFTQATLDAAESAADMAILLHTQAGAEFNDPDGSEQTAEAAGAFSTVPFERRMMVALPQGYDATQFEAKQPTQMYSNFKREIAAEIGRCENVSRNVVLLDSSESNFASGQLDHRTTYRQHDIDREDAGMDILDRVLRAWLDEASLISGYLPQSLRTPQTPPHSWHWDSNELGDPLKMAKSKRESLASGLTSLPAEYAARGLDWNKALELAARGYGITRAELLALIRQSVFTVPAQAASAADETENPDGEPAKPPRSAREEP